MSSAPIRENEVPSVGATAARFDPTTGMISVDLNRGYTITFHKTRHQALHRATDEQLSEIDVMPSSIFFPKLDDGFTVEGLIAGRFGRDWWEKQWMDTNQTQPACSTLMESQAA